MRSLPRFLLQAGLLIAAAAVAAVVHLGAGAIVLVMAATFAIVVLGEWLATRVGVGRAPDGPSPSRLSAPAQPRPQRPTSRPAREPAQPLARPAARTRPVPPATPEALPPRRREPVAQPPPAVASPQLPARAQLEPEPVAEPPAVVPTPEPQVAAPVVERRRWNVFDLESRARQVARLDPARGEELSALLLYLRTFGDADGELAEEFDPFVRDAFADLIGW